MRESTAISCSRVRVSASSRHSSDGSRVLATPMAVVCGLTYNFLPFMILPLYASLERIDGRLLADASPGPGERIVVAPIDISALRHERATRTGHQMLAHLRTEAYPVYLGHRYPPR